MAAVEEEVSAFAQEDEASYALVAALGNRNCKHSGAEDTAFGALVEASFVGSAVEVGPLSLLQHK